MFGTKSEFEKFLDKVKKGKVEVPIYDPEGNFLRNATPEEIENTPENLTVTLEGEIPKSFIETPADNSGDNGEIKTEDTPPVIDPPVVTPPAEITPPADGVAVSKGDGVDYSGISTDNLAKDYFKPKALRKGNSLVRKNNPDGVGTLYIKEASGTETELSYYSTLDEVTRKIYKEKGKIF